MSSEPKSSSSTGPSDAVVEAYKLGRRHGIEEARQQPCAPVGHQACDLPFLEPSPSASVPDGQPERQPGAQVSQRKTQGAKHPNS